MSRGHEFGKWRFLLERSRIYRTLTMAYLTLEVRAQWLSIGNMTRPRVVFGDKLIKDNDVARLPQICRFYQRTEPLTRHPDKLLWFRKVSKYLELMYNAFSALSLLRGGSTCNDFDQLSSDDGLTGTIV